MQCKAVLTLNSGLKRKTVNKIIINIRGIVQAWENAPAKVSGQQMATLPILNDAWLRIENGKISGMGEMSSLSMETNSHGSDVIDASGRFVFPAWCDSHTHIVYAASRDQEFVDRISGLTYEEIAARGGGILNSAKRLAAASEEELFEGAWKRLDEVMLLGTGAIEIKSGYGLDLENELKMLRVIQRLKEKHPLTVRSTFLGAHALPLAYKGNQEGYVQHIIDEMIPAVAAEGLADFIDVFCEKNYFTVSDTERILEAGAKRGLRAKVHVNQFNVIGGVAASVRHNALSVDHLEVISDEDIEALKTSATMPVALPGCSLFINIPYTPARKIIDAGLPLALATDFNPGSSPSGNMNLVASLACIKMQMTPVEVIHAGTLNGAYAMGIESDFGHISKGAVANLFITKEMNSIAELPYYFGSNPVWRMLVNGELV